MLSTLATAVGTLDTGNTLIPTRSQYSVRARPSASAPTDVMSVTLWLKFVTMLWALLLLLGLLLPTALLPPLSLQVSALQLPSQ